MTAASGIMLPGHDHYEKLRKALLSGGRSQIEKILESLVKTCQTKRDYVGEKQKIDDDQMNFWFNDVLRLLFDWENPVTRELALRASEAILPHLGHTLYLDSPAWPALKTQISNVFSNLLEQARGRNDPEWHRKWSVLVRILDREICQGAMIINVFLAIVESGFRSSELLVREQSFDCWMLLVEIFAKYNQIHIQKRIKLICIPLKSSKSKTEVIAKKKFEIWWFLINKLQSQLDMFADNVFEPFIYFCFGPSFKTPLCYYFDESYREFGAPGKIYNSIKQLSAAVLIRMLGPAGKVTETLHQEVSSGEASNGIITGLPSGDKTIISSKLFTLKAKLIINSCTECTVLFSQMKDKDYILLNQCLWQNLLAMIEQEKIIPRSEMLGWITENLTALISLSTQLKDDAMRELLYDTVQMVAQTNLLAVTIGQDSPEQLVNNYRTFMTLLFNPHLDYSAGTSFTILSHVFDLRRYSSSQRSGYWDMLQKTTQYLTDLEPSLLQNHEAKSTSYRRMVTQIYRSMALHLKEQIDSHRDQFEQSQSIVFGFLLFPLEYDRFLEVDDVRDVWCQVYAAMVTGHKSTRYACGISEVIKAMTVAKYNCNLGVILEFFRVVLESVPGDFEIGQPPLKTIELFKDLVRKALVFQNSLLEVGKGVASFRKLIEKMTIKALLVVIMPIRNVISELVSGESEILKEDVKATLKTLVDRFGAGRFVTELKSQPKEVKWNCKMLISQLLELPSDMQKQWKMGELKKLVDICEGKEPIKPPKPVKKEGEFVVIEKVWKFTPDKLTEHQKDRMKEKRHDIPALYNDLSQSQDSFVIKPWTPNKIVIPSDERQDHDTIVMCASGESSSIPNGGAPEASVPKEQGAGVTTENKLDKENNNGNVQNSEEKTAPGSSTSVPTRKKAKIIRELDLLKIDTIEGKTLQAAKMPRTRRAGSLEPAALSNNRRKSVDPKKMTESRRSRRNAEKTAEKKENKQERATSSARKKSEDRSKSPMDRNSPRKVLNFDNVVDKEPTAATEAPSTSSPVKSKAVNESVDEIIESSQANSQSLLSRKYTPRKPKDEDKEEASNVAAETLPFDTEAEKELEKLNRKSPMKVKADEVLKSPIKNTRAAVAAAQQQEPVTEMETEPNSELPETVPNTEPSDPVPSGTEIDLKSPAKSPAKSPKKGKRTISPAPEPMETESKPEQLPDTNPNTEPSEPAAAVARSVRKSKIASQIRQPVTSSRRGRRSVPKPVAKESNTDQLPETEPNTESAAPVTQIDLKSKTASPPKSPVKSPRKGNPSIEPMETESTIGQLPETESNTEPSESAPPEAQNDLQQRIASPIKSSTKNLRKGKRSKEVMETESVIVQLPETEPNTEPTESAVPETQIDLKSKIASPTKSPLINLRKSKRSISPAVAPMETESVIGQLPETEPNTAITESASPVTEIASACKSPVKSQRKSKRSISPAVEPNPESSETASPVIEEDLHHRIASPSKSPIKSLRKSKRSVEPMDLEPAIDQLPEIEPNTESSESTAPETEIDFKSKTASPAKSPRKGKRSTSPAVEPTVTEASLSEPKTEVASPAKSPRKGKRSISPAAKATKVESQSPEKSDKPEEGSVVESPNLSPVRNLDEVMEPLVRNLNRSVVSSPGGLDQEEREADLLNSTLNISPIPDEKAHPSTPTIATAVTDHPGSGSGEKRASSRIMDREKGSAMPSPITRRTRNSPPVLPAAVANLRNRTPQMTPRSPSTNRIELRGRGAQLINLIRSQQNESSPKPSSGPSPQHSSTPKTALATPSDRSTMLRKLATAATTNTTQSPEQCKTLDKEKEKEYLVFSKVLPSPQASPAASILKRKHNQDDSGDDIESPANKRKRVSFHDPPVSLTKEYIRQEEECRSPSISRCLLMAGMSPLDKAKFLLRRKSKADSISELAKFTRGSSAKPVEPGKDEEEEISSSPESLDGEFMLNTTDNMSVLQVTSGADDIEPKENPTCSITHLPAATSIPAQPIEPIELPKRTSPRKISPKPIVEQLPSIKTSVSPLTEPVPAPAPAPVVKPDISIRFQTEEEILAHVISKYSLDMIMERSLAAGKTLEQQKSARLITRELSTLMSKNSKIRHTVLDELSERHSAEFLEHAVQENSSAMVCQRLSMTTMTEYIFEKLRQLPPEGGNREDQEERIKILQIMFDQLAQMHTCVGGDEFVRMRERFVKAAVFSKSRTDVMALLEEYFSKGITNASTTT